MPFPIRVRPQVEADIHEAMAWYLFDGTEVVVLACIHERRSPEQWPGSV